MEAGGRGIDGGEMIRGDEETDYPGPVSEVSGM